MDTLRRENIPNGRSKQKFTIRKQGEALIRLAQMLENGFSLKEALIFLLYYQEKAPEEWVRTINHALLSGNSLADVFEMIGYGKHICSQVYFAEVHGNMSKTLSDGGYYLLQKKKEKEKLQKTLQYPFVLIILVIVIIMVINTLLLPQFSLLGQTLNYKASGMAEVLVFFLHFLPTILFVFLLMFTLILILVYLIRKRTSPFTQASISVMIPFLSFYTKNYITHFLSRELGFLLKTGMSINNALQVFEKQSSKRLFAEMAKQFQNQLINGHSFPEILQDYPLLTDDFYVMVKHGENNGELYKELELYSTICIERMEMRTDFIMKLIHPITFGGVGLLLVLVYLGIMLPMYQMIQTI
ncbi:hypothetical protein Q73_09275 [Bacillus coahuilensis m2-6]|uniref:competence type IV pilus assembly protein ComGB n=1 Tax=Bacillus coahuilensis TaxID=408580 RepID=UPI0007502209|nr:competence type IV pilus assembly protein ComGB [Bacillus coahuilensis]KUP07397.1 hypothetical protein Q73_09275 [Bacillus coahuilensis m2-6]